MGEKDGKYVKRVMLISGVVKDSTVLGGLMVDQYGTVQYCTDIVL